MMKRIERELFTMNECNRQVLNPIIIEVIMRLRVRIQGVMTF